MKQNTLMLNSEGRGGGGGGRLSKEMLRFLYISYCRQENFLLSEIINRRITINTFSIDLLNELSSLE